MPIPAPRYSRDWSQQVINYFKTFLPKENLDAFKRDLDRMNKESPNKHYEIREIKPPRNGIAYSCTYDRHTMVSKPPMKSSFAHITQYWDVNGNCIGFDFEGQQFTFPSQNIARPTVTMKLKIYDEESKQTTEVEFPADSDIVKYKQPTNATVTISRTKDGRYKIAEEYSHQAPSINHPLPLVRHNVYFFDTNGKRVGGFHEKGIKTNGNPAKVKETTKNITNGSEKEKTVILTVQVCDHDKGTVEIKEIAFPANSRIAGYDHKRTLIRKTRIGYKVYVEDPQHPNEYHLHNVYGPKGELVMVNYSHGYQPKPIFHPKNAPQKIQEWFALHDDATYLEQHGSGWRVVYFKPNKEGSVEHLPVYHEVIFDAEGNVISDKSPEKTADFKSAQKKIENKIKLKQPRVTVKDR